MVIPLEQALPRLRDALLADDLIRAVASGRRRHMEQPWRRVEVRPVDLRAGRHLQVTSFDETQALARNVAAGTPAEQLVDELLGSGFSNWHVQTGSTTLQLRVTKRGDGQLHESAPPTLPTAGTAQPHDRTKQRLLDPADAWLVAIGISDERGRVKPSRQDKHRQVEEFCRQLATVVDDALTTGVLRTPTADAPLRVADLGCGNAYLTFAAYRWLTQERGLPVAMTGVDVKQQARRRNTELADGLAASGLRFVDADIGAVPLDPAPEVVLALHACDTATDDALARAVRWRAPLVLAAPCCHHHLQAQLRRQPAPAPYGLVTRHGILRERLADTLTDALRAALLRLHGYRVEVVEFVASRHTPRNSLLRAVRTGAIGSAETLADYYRLVEEWQVRPRLGELIGVGPAAPPAPVEAARTR